MPGIEIALVAALTIQAGPGAIGDQDLFHCKWAGEIATHEYEVMSVFGARTPEDVARAKLVAGRAAQEISFRRTRAGGEARLAAAESAATSHGRNLRDMTVLDAEVARCAGLFGVR